MTTAFPATTTVSGLDLKIARLGARVEQRAVARFLGIDPSVVSRWESSLRVSEEAVRRYAEALEQILDGRDSSVARLDAIPPDSEPTS